MKLCARCGELKALSDFHKNAVRKDGVQTFCKPCRADIDHGRYEEKVGRGVPRAPQHSERGRKAWLLGLKVGRPCFDCGRIYPHQVMQWDHRPGAEKIGNIGADFWGRTREEVLAEIAKCDLVCTNCHAIRTFRRNGWATRWIQEASAMDEPAPYAGA